MRNKGSTDMQFCIKTSKDIIITVIESQFQMLSVTLFYKTKMAGPELLVIAEFDSRVEAA
jgi:hypothetical protein